MDELGEEFPILCETCLGENPFIRMTKQAHAKACKICERPFTVYRWKPGPRARYKKTELCHTCAKLKNVCQTCVLDLQFGLPVQVRDSTLEDHEKAVVIPFSDVNREYMIEQHEKKLRNFDPTQQQDYGKILTGSATAGMERLARKTPYYRRNLPHVCSFFAKGECNRGSLCPYRHEMPKDPNGPLANQNIQDRYYGRNDPVAQKMLSRMSGKGRRGPSGPLELPDDPTITTLWVGGVGPQMRENSIRTKFAKYGPLSGVRVIAAKSCAFITYLRRDSAESAAEELHGECMVDGTNLRIAWGKRQSNSRGGGGTGRGAVPPPPGVVNKNAGKFLQRPPGKGSGGPRAPPPGVKNGGGLPPAYYPSQDPSNMGAKLF
jgi:pre-mRNA-splicing factor RBM22/SLT11